MKVKSIEIQTAGKYDHLPEGTLYGTVTVIGDNVKTEIKLTQETIAAICSCLDTELAITREEIIRKLLGANNNLLAIEHDTN